VDLEHARLRAGMLPMSAESSSTSGRRGLRPKPQLPRDYAAACWQHPQAALSGVLPQQQPFRDDARPDTTLVWLPDEDEGDALKLYRVEDLRNGKRSENDYIEAPELLHDIALKPATGISRWGEFDLPALVGEQADARDLSLDQAARKFTTVDVPSLKDNAQGWCWHPWLGFSKKR
jgi:CRISPR-associated endonuclease/helicase Cas3